MLIRTKDEDEGVGLEACEFWLTLAEQQNVCRDHLVKYLPRLPNFLSISNVILKIVYLDLFRSSLMGWSTPRSTSFY